MIPRPVANLEQTLADWRERPEAWLPLVRHDPDERISELLYRDSDIEVYVISWMSGHDTGFHDHDHSAAAITVLQGAITEERLAFNETVKTLLTDGDSVTIAKEAIHRVRHAGTQPAITLHAYSPPLARVGTYEIADDGALLRHPRPAETPLEAAA
jgi:predicted metal-dependent enzyme (double-stranded beta helix superfamily)